MAQLEAELDHHCYMYNGVPSRIVLDTMENASLTKLALKQGAARPDGGERNREPYWIVQSERGD